MPELERKDVWDELLGAYRERLTKQGRSHVSVLTHLNPPRKLIDFVREKGVAKPEAITSDFLKEFQLFYLEKRDFTQLTVKTYMLFIRLFFDFLVASGTVKDNPAFGIELLEKREFHHTQLSHFYTFEEVLRRYLEDQKRWVSYAYIDQVQKHLNGFFRYLLANQLKSVYPVTEAVLLRYREYLWDEFVHVRNHSLVVHSQIERLRCAVRLFRYLYKEGILKDDPAEHLSWTQYYQEIQERAKTLHRQRPSSPELTEKEKLMLKFLEYEQARGKSPQTLRHYRRSAAIFFAFMKEKGIENVAQVNKRLLLEYYTYLCRYVGTRGRPVSNGFKASVLNSTKLFFRFLVRFEYLDKDPSFDLESIRYEDGLPRTCMNEREILEILEQPKLNHDPLNIRDKAIMEVLFSTGVRSNELCQLNLEDIDHQQELIRINSPKGGPARQRVIPIGKVALDYVSFYLKEARPKLENGDPKALFLSYSGHRLVNDSVWQLVKKYKFQAGIRKNITTHSFRVTCATLMLKNGADIRYVQEQLGHKNITSTQVYTRLTPVDLKSAHQRFHPRERKNVPLEN